MLWLDCPRCGRRPLDEFTFGGERRAVPDWITDPDERDFDEVWIFENPDGVTTERWFHAVRLPALADGPARHLDRYRRGGRRVTRLADRQIEIVLRNRVFFGVGAIERLPEVVASAGGSRVFVVTDPGVRGSGVIDRVLGVLAGRRASRPASSPRSSRTRAPRPSSAARRRCGRSGWTARSSSPVGGGSSMDTAKALDLRASERPPGLGARVRRPGPGARAAASSRCRPPPGPAPRPTRSASSPTRRPGARATSATRRCCPVATILDPVLTVGLPPAATAATGIDAMTHSLESLLSRQPEPVRRGDGPRRHPDRRGVAAGGGRRRLGPRGALADAGRLAPGGRRPGQRHRGRARPRAGPLDRDARPGRPRDRAGDRPARGPALLPRRRATASSRSSGSRSASRRPPNPIRPRAGVAIGAIEQLLRDVDQRPTLRRLGLADDDAIDQLVSDTLDDAAIRNSPRLPTASEAREILVSVSG